MQDQFVRYIRILGISLCIGLVAVGLINWVIDPYDDLGKNWIGVYTDDSRAKSIVSFPHNAIIIGSSRTMHINPDDLCEYKFYNASMGGALPEQLYYFLEKYAKNEKLVAIGLDFATFNENNRPLLNIDKWPDRNWPIQEYLLGWNVIIDSFKAIYKREYLHYEGPNNGFLPLFNSKKPDIQAYQWYINYFVNDYKDYRLSEVRFQYMRKLKQLLEARHIKYIVFTNPMQEDHWNALRLSGSYGIYLQWVNRLSEIFPGLKTFPEGQYSQKELYKNDDPSHYFPALGATILNDLLGCK